jgi:hypothetical protein
VICAMGRLAIGLKLIMITRNCKQGVNKFNHLIQNPILLATEPRTRDNIHMVSCTPISNRPTA